MRPISKSGGSRQRIWNVLRSASRPLPAGEIATRARADQGTVWGYLSGLKSHGYAANGDEGWTLEKNTGPRSPSINVNEGRFHDWNLAPSMSPAELRRAFKKSGLSMNQFGVAVGVGENNGTRIREMMDGGRPVSPKVEQGANKFLKPR